MATDASPSLDSIHEMLDRWFPGDDIALQQLRAQLESVRLPQGCEVFHRGDTCNNYLLVIEGVVRVQTLSPSGREVVLYRIQDSQSCVISTSCLISNEPYPADAIAETDTTVVAISRGVFNEALACSKHFREFVFSNQGKRLCDLIRRIETIALGRVDARLARLLFDRCQHHGGNIQITHRQLASDLGTAREVVSRQLKAFAQQGLIDVTRGNVRILRPQELVRIWNNAG